MNSVYRKEIKLRDSQQVTVTGRIIKAAPSRTSPEDAVDIWWEHNDWQPSYMVTVFMAATGGVVPWRNPLERDSGWRYVDSCITPTGFVWHVYVGAGNQ